MCSISLYMPWSNMVYVVCSSIPWWESLHWVYQSLSMDWWPSPMYAYVHFFIASENLPKSKLFVGWGRAKTCTNPIVSICRLQHVAIVHMYEYKCRTPSKKRWISLKSDPNIVAKLTLHLLGVTAIGGYYLGYKQCCVHRTRIGFQKNLGRGFHFMAK